MLGLASLSSQTTIKMRWIPSVMSGESDKYNS